MTKLNCGIYEIKNKVTGDLYIGQSRSLKERKKSHFTSLDWNKHHSYLLQNDYNLYGKDCFEFKIILYCEIGQLTYYEQSLVDRLNPKYNIRKLCVTSPLGTFKSAETKNKLSIIAKNISEETRHRMSVAHIGKSRGPHSQETKDKIGKANSAKRASPSTKQRLSESHKGKKLTQEQIQKRTETRRKNGWLRKNR